MILPWAPESYLSVFNYVPGQSQILSGAKQKTEELTPAYQGNTNRVSSEKSKTNTSGGGVLNSESINSQEITTGLTSSEGTNSKWKFRNMLSMLWLTGAVVMGIYICGSNLKLWRIVRGKKQVTNEKFLDLLEGCKERMGINTVLGVFATDEVASPCVFGFIRPRLLMPPSMINSLGASELRYVLLHELGHVKRHDIGVNWVVAVLQMIHWFNPLVWYGFHRMRADREVACDALALSRGSEEESIEYGRTIVGMLERFSRRRYIPSVAGIVESKNELQRRIMMIGQFKNNSYRWSLPAMLFLAVFGVVVLTNAAEKQQTEASREAIAREFAESLAGGNYTAARSHFDDKMKKALSVEKMERFWNSKAGNSGEFKKISSTKVRNFGDFEVVEINCEFEKGPLELRVYFHNGNIINWFRIMPMAEEMKVQKSAEEAAKEASEREQLEKIAEARDDLMKQRFDAFKRMTELVDLPELTPETSLAEAIHILKYSAAPPYKIAVLWSDIAKEGVNSKTPVNTGPIKRIPLFTALYLLFRNAGATDVGVGIIDGVIVVATNRIIERKGGYGGAYRYCVGDEDKHKDGSSGYSGGGLSGQGGYGGSNNFGGGNSGHGGYAEEGFSESGNSGAGKYNKDGYEKPSDINEVGIKPSYYGGSTDGLPERRCSLKVRPYVMKDMKRFLLNIE